MIISYKSIKELTDKNLLILDGVKPKQIAEVSVDVPLGQYIFIEESTLGLTEKEIFECTRNMPYSLYGIDDNTTLSYTESLRQKYYFRTVEDVMRILNVWKRVEARIEKAGRVWLKVDITEPIIIPRLTFFLGYTDQYVGTVGGSNIAMLFYLKSTDARHGINHPLAGLAEPGYFSKLCVELMPVVEHLEFKKGLMVGQMMFSETTSDFQDYSLKASYQKGNTLDEVRLNWKPEDILPKKLTYLEEL